MPKRETEINTSIFTGLDLAKGDRLVDVVGLWGYRIEKVYQNSEYDRVVNYSSNVIPLLIRKIKNQDTDIALRATLAKTLASFGIVLDKLVNELPDSETIRTAQRLRRGVLKGFDFCFSFPTAVFGISAVTTALNEFTQSDDVIALKQKYKIS
ncbi:hypothetical protein M1615_03295 [Patescibacteria group bacterium]|nr:hypothetical protein [Patescibacteria group bacterium]